MNPQWDGSLSTVYYNSEACEFERERVSLTARAAEASETQLCPLPTLIHKDSRGKMNRQWQFDLKEKK